MRYLGAFFVGLQVLCGAAAGAQQAPLSPAPRSETDRAARLMTEVAIGGAGAAAAGLGFAVLGGSVIGPHGGEDPGLLGIVIGTIVGIPVGSSIGAYLGAKAFGAPARYGDALGGAALGMGTFLLLVMPVAQLDPDYPP